MRTFTITALSLLATVISASAFTSALPKASFLSDSFTANPSLRDGFRPPAVPLIVHTPTISVWSYGTNLTDISATHWSDNINDFRGLINIDGTVYNWLGPGGLCSDRDNRIMTTAAPGCSVIPLQQTSVSVQPTQTFYTFSNGKGVDFRVAFTTPAFPTSLKTMAKPWTYISWVVTPTDGKPHTVSVHLDHTAEVTLQDSGQNVQWSDVSSSFSAGMQNIHAIKMGSYKQVYFDRSGDNSRNDWGFAYSVAQGANVQHTVTDSNQGRRAFVNGDAVPQWDIRVPRAANDQWPIALFRWDLGSITAASSGFSVFAYDDVYSMDFFHDYQRPYWHQLYNGDVYAMLQDSLLSYPQLMADADAYDTTLIAQLQATTAQNAYPTLASLVHRQAVGASVVVWNEKLQKPWVFLEEISSDGDISTVDVVFPAAPIFLQQGPEVLQAMLLPLLAYGNNETDMPYRLNWAPHHLGEWPIADLDAEEQEQMPVEESANILILLAGIAQKQNGDVGYLAQYFPLLDIWNGYLAANLPDPNFQLCTDDFEGPSPHNVNLAIKGTLGMAAYSVLLTYKGETDHANSVMAQAKAFATQIVANAATSTGDHLRMQFNLPDSWSQKYNLLWQYILNTNLYDDSIANTEMTYYLAQSTRWGFALDNRHPFTKADWSSWSIAMARNSTQADLAFEQMYNWAHESPDREPYSDWYQINQPKIQGFKARPVMGGLYAKLLEVSSRKAAETAQVVEM